MLGTSTAALADWEPFTGETVEITMQPDGPEGKDTWVYETSLEANTNYGNQANFNAGNTEGDTGNTQRSFLEFDISQIPCGATIDSAILSVRQYLQEPPYLWDLAPPDPPEPWDYDFAIYRVVASWDEGTITWNNQPNHDSTAFGQKTVNLLNPPVETWQDFDVTSLVGGWYDGTWDNYGMVIRLVNENDLCKLSFYSSDFSLPDYRPKLTINYTKSNYKMNCPQLPDLDVATGMDISSRAVEPAMPLADNFVCTESGPITDIHVWGSWAEDLIPEGTAEEPDPTFTIFINDTDPSGYPQPGPNVLWSRIFSPGDYTVRKYADTPGEVFWDPLIPPFSTYGSAHDSEVYQYNFYIDHADAFTQTTGTQYWLSIVADYGHWGWKMPGLRIIKNQTCPFTSCTRRLYWWSVSL